jgi:hypothetical protein
VVEHRKPATPRQLAELRNEHGYMGTVYSYEEAQKLLTERRTIAKVGIVTAWAQGEKTLAQGYRVEPMEQDFCYRVHRPTEAKNNPDGPTVAYHVCLSDSLGLPPCDCPNATHNSGVPGHQCKHRLAVSVHLWQWAQESESPEIYTAYLQAAGVIALRSGAKSGSIEAKSNDSGAKSTIRRSLVASP